jgi:hypothetical protein
MFNTIRGNVAKNCQLVIADEKIRRLNDLHDKERLRQEAMIEALLREKRLLSNQLEHKIEYTMDDTAYETLMHEIFHLLTTWCFSNFKVGAGPSY